MRYQARLNTPLHALLITFRFIISLKPYSLGYPLL